MDGELSERLARLEERSNHIIGKIDNLRENSGKIFEKLDDLPCGAMKEKVKGINSKIAWMWTVIILISGSIIGIAIRALAK